MSFFDELKRRNVIRVGIAYVIVAWLILQFADVVLNNIAAPGWVFQVIMLLLGIGFPVVLIIAWAFEMTPEGIKKEKDVDRSQSITPKTGRKLDRTIIAVLVFALGYFIYDKFITQTPATPAPVSVSPAATDEDEAPQSTEQSIAVLPFVNMSADPEQEFFSDGISEELLNLLVRVEGLKVASRTSSFTYKGENRNIPEIAAELKVGHILEGSVRKAGNRVRITAQLIDTTNDRHLWSETFDRELVDIFAIQDEIANAIVSALKGTLGVGQKAITVEAVTENLDAYDLYLKARGLFLARQDLALSIALFEQATRLDPEFARAWEGLAAVQWVAADWLAGDGIDHHTPSLQAAEHALNLDSNLSMPHAVLGMNFATAEEKFDAGMMQLDLAVSKDPKNTTARLWRGIVYKGLGYMDLAVSDFQACLDVDSGYQNCKQHQAEALLKQGNEAEAIRLFEQTIEDNFHSTDEYFVPYYVRSGHRIAALLMADAMTRGTYAPVKYWIQAIENPTHDHSGALAKFREWSEKSGQPLDGFPAILVALDAFDLIESNPLNAGLYIWHPDSKEFRKTEHFNRYAKDHYLAFWQKHGFPEQCRAKGENDFECD